MIMFCNSFLSFFLIIDFLFLFLFKIVFFLIDSIIVLSFGNVLISFDLIFESESFANLKNKMDIFIHMVRVFANGPGDLDSIPDRVIPKTQKMVLDATLLNTQHYKVRIKSKVEGDPKAPFSVGTTPWCSGGCYYFPLIAPLYPWS